MADQITEEQGAKLAEQIALMKQVPTSMLTDVTVTDTDIDGMKMHTTVNTESEPLNKPITDGNNGNSTVAPSNIPGAKKGVKVSSLVTGEKAVRIVDFVFPALFILILKNITGREVEKSRLQATKDERELLAPVVHDYLESISLELTPLNALLICLGVVYGTKTIEIMNEPAPKKADIKPAEIAPGDKQRKPGTFSSTYQPLNRKRKRK